MRYKYEDIEKFMKFKTWTDKDKIDKLLEIDCSLYAHLGTDSTRSEKEEVKKRKVLRKFYFTKENKKIEEIVKAVIEVNKDE